MLEKWSGGNKQNWLVLVLMLDLYLWIILWIEFVLIVLYKTQIKLNILETKVIIRLVNEDQMSSQRGTSL